MRRATGLILIALLLVPSLGLAHGEYYSAVRTANAYTDSSTQATKAEFTNRIGLAETNIKMDVSLTRTQLTNALKSVRSGQKQNGESLAKNFEFQNNLLRDLFVQFGTAQEKARNQRLYGPKSRPFWLCVGPESGKGSQAGATVEKETAQNLFSAMKDYNTRWTNFSTQRAYLEEKDLEAWTSSAQQLLPQSSTLTLDEVKGAKEAAQLITNPAPEVILPDRAQNTPSGKNHAILQRVKHVRLTLPQQAFANSIASNTPTTTLGDLATDIHQEMGNSGQPTEVVDGQISQRALLDLQVQSRYSNPKWYQELAEMEEPGVLKEIALMQATQLEIQNRNLELLQTLVLLMAQGVASDTNEVIGPLLEQLRVKAQKGTLPTAPDQ